MQLHRAGIGFFSLNGTGFRVRGDDGRDFRTGPVPGVFGFRIGDSLRDMRLLAPPAKGDRSVDVVDGEGNKLLHLPNNCDAVSSPDGGKVAVRFSHSGDIVDRFTVFDLATQKGIDFIGHEGQVYEVVFSPDGKQIASVSEDATARIWDVQSARPVAVFRGHAVKVLTVAFRADGGRVVTASADGTVASGIRHGPGGRATL